jgi:hypothetical protein
MSDSRIRRSSLANGIRRANLALIWVKFRIADIAVSDVVNLRISKCTQSYHTLRLNRLLTRTFHAARTSEHRFEIEHDGEVEQSNVAWTRAIVAKRHQDPQATEEWFQAVVYHVLHVVLTMEPEAFLSLDIRKFTLVAIHIFLLP